MWHLVLLGAMPAALVTVVGWGWLAARARHRWARSLDQPHDPIAAEAEAWVAAGCPPLVRDLAEGEYPKPGTWRIARPGTAASVDIPPPPDLTALLAAERAKWGRLRADEHEAWEAIRAEHVDAMRAIG
jgi:hypothetical protein